jgi:hypothetical protein
MIVKEKGRTQGKLIQMYNMYILPTQTRIVACYKTDLGGCPTTNNTATVLTTAWGSMPRWTD